MAPTFQAIGVVATDLAKTLAFYRDLGFDIPPEADKEPHVEVTLAGGIRLMWDPLDTVHSFDPDFEPARGDGRISFAFACTDAADVDDAYARMVRAGHTGHKEPWNAPWGQRYATLHDPDGNAVDLFAPLTTS